MDWVSRIERSVRRRDAVEREPFRSVFGSYAAALRSQATLQSRSFNVQQDNGRLRAQIAELQASLQRLGVGESSSAPAASSATAVSGASSEEMQAQIEDLKRAMARLRDELTEAYRQGRADAKSLLGQKERIDQLVKQTAEKEKVLDETRAELRKAKETIANLYGTVKTFTDENNTLRAMLNEAEARRDELQTQNDEYLTHILAIKNQQAAEMNQVNDMLEHMQRQQDVTAHSIAERVRAGDGVETERKISSVESFDTNAILDAVAWQSNFNVAQPTKVHNAMQGHNGQCTSIRYNASGTMLVSGGTDTIVKVWDVRHGKLKGTLRGAQKSVMSVCFSPNDRYVLASGNDQMARLWSLDTSKMVHVLSSHQKKVYAAVFSGDSRQVITGSHDKTIKVWGTHKGELERTIPAQSSVHFISASPNGDLFASAHLDRCVRLWSLEHGECFATLKHLHTQSITCSEFSRDGTMLLTNSRENVLKIVDVRTHDVVKTLVDDQGEYHNGANWTRAVFSPDGQYVLTGGQDGKLYIWSLHNMKLVTRLSMPDDVKPESLAARKRSQSMSASGGGGGGNNNSGSRSPSLSSSSGGARRGSSAVDQHPLNVTCVAWNRNGRQVASCNNSGQIVLWEP
eukprot:TRINITY_DN49331_c0_g1_i1.p1 TRINITY_DN49331_c0_g1~~TRINITY_DN49331_c0_g1_i1.p1  ORF type:complete len:628 (+),score=277.84 TRINITY_DN49331_c0_g1_i1:2-1885(+)